MVVQVSMMEAYGSYMVWRYLPCDSYRTSRINNESQPWFITDGESCTFHLGEFNYTKYNRDHQHWWYSRSG